MTSLLDDWKWGGGTKISYEVTKVSEKKKIWRNEKTIKLIKGSKLPKKVRTSMFKQRRQSKIVRLVLRIKAFLREKKQWKCDRGLQLWNDTDNANNTQIMTIWIQYLGTWILEWNILKQVDYMYLDNFMNKLNGN